MQCPVCAETQLVMTSRQDIEIDYCPKCRGVWLDRGELDKIIERSQREESVGASRPQTMQPATPPMREDYRGDHGHGGGRHGSGHGGGRHGGFLKRLFD